MFAVARRIVDAYIAALIQEPDPNSNFAKLETTSVVTTKIAHICARFAILSYLLDTHQV